MDTEDYLYITGMALIGVGAGMYSAALACVCVGALLILPPIIRGIARTRK